MQRSTENPIEFKRGIIRDMFIKLKPVSSSGKLSVIAAQSVTSSNDLYGNDIVSAFKLARGFTRSVIHDNVNKKPGCINRSSKS